MVQAYQPQILIVGPGRSGKDESGIIVNEISSYRFGGSTSLFLCPYVARCFGMTEEEAYATRHDMREAWWHIGKAVRAVDAGALVDKALHHGPVVAGIRDYVEIVHAIVSTGFADVVWVERDVDKDPTLEFTLEDCQKIARPYADRTQVSVIQNNGTVTDLKRSWIEFFKQRHPHALKPEYQC